MRGGILSVLRQGRGWIIHAVVLALVLPVLSGLLPAPALSATAALDRDIAVSLCATANGEAPDGQQQHPARHDACVLCALGGALSGPAPGDAAVVAIARMAGKVLHPRQASTGLQPSHFLTGSPPRGPPAFPSV
jgi:hypothetical protein